MIVARLTVLFNIDCDDDGNPREENLGEIMLAAMPGTGDVIDVLRDGQIEADVVTVKRVIHYAVSVPTPDAVSFKTRRNEPSLEIVADYTPFSD